MSNDIDNTAPASIRLLIEQYVQGRLNDKLVKLSTDNSIEREKTLAKYEIETWLEDASLRISQIRLVTHTPKQHHSSSKATAVFLKQQIAQHPYIGSIAEALEPDVIGNAAVLDIFKLLRLKYQDVTLLDRLLNADPEFIQALSKDPQLAEIRYQRFLAFSEMPEQFNAGRLAKQVYFPVQNDSYHVLAILYPSALVHGVYRHISNDRFGEQSKATREARFKKKFSTLESREYPELLVQNFGGSKPQNISQLNSDRGGSMWLLASLPPSWTGQAIQLPKGRTVFGSYLSQRKDIKLIINQFIAMYRKGFLENNIEFRSQRDELLQQLVDCVIDMGIELQQVAPTAWTIAHANFNRAESFWLDRGYREQLFIQEQSGTLTDEEQVWLSAYRQRDWHNEIGQSFGQWLNQTLMSKTKLQDLDDHVGRIWSIALRDQLRMLTEEFA